MQFLTLYWWEWLAYLLGFSSFIINGLWLVTTLPEGPKPNGGNPSTPTLPNSSEILPEVKPRGRVTVWIGMPILVLIGAAAGYGIRDHQLVSNSHTYWDVAILDKYSDISFRIQPARMQDGQWDFCNPVPFQKHDELRYITFEQQNGCKRLQYFQKLDARLGEKINAALR